METEQFITQFERLNGPDGEWPGYYKQQKIARIWESFKHRDIIFFSLVIDTALDQCRFAPTPADLKKFAGTITDSEYNKQKAKDQGQVKDLFSGKTPGVSDEGKKALAKINQMLANSAESELEE